MTYGWMGKILDVDLTHSKLQEKPLDRTVARKFIGGRKGLA